MKTEYIKHHISGKTIAGYGIAHLIKMYNLHSISECNFHHLVPGNIEEVRGVEEYVKVNFVDRETSFPEQPLPKKPVQVQEMSKAALKKTKKVARKKSTKK